MTTRLLGLDYPGRRVGARITDLDLSPFGIELTELMRDSLPVRFTARDYALDLLSRSPLASDGVHAILAYCAAAPIAQEMAQLLVERGVGPVPLVLFDADPCGADALWQGCSACVAEADGQASIAPLSTSMLSDLLDDPRALVDVLEKDLSDRVLKSLAADDLSEEELVFCHEQIVRSMLDYLIYLVSAYHSARPAWGGSVLHIASEGHPYCEPWQGASQTQLIRVKCDRADLLRHPDTVEAVSAFVKSH
ncbi:hypothetical protein GCM10027160_52470 [Streptomyces calidiresistens]|uniref:Uncharacterized protein n=1 Tax=Streptomyces calidiresistens TaxID=1485586 RepID=A0A7W3XUS3_9ACTN|nr:hypothetical protein [Streptomyces calidiresistens]MBB0227994.1 hypothetical protein [Streptomyces calidiresistens]